MSQIFSTGGGGGEGSGKNGGGEGVTEGGGGEGVTEGGGGEGVTEGGGGEGEGVGVLPVCTAKQKTDMVMHPNNKKRKKKSKHTFTIRIPREAR